MERFQIYRNSSIDWIPSPVVALAASPDASQVAAARADGSLDLFLVSPGSVGWHCQLTIQGDPKSRISSLIWCRASSKSMSKGRLLSSSIDGSVSEWDLFALKQKVVVDSVGVSIWQMAEEPLREPADTAKLQNGYHDTRANSYDSEESSGSDKSDVDDDDDSLDLHATSAHDGSRIAIACDDGCIRLFNVSGSDDLTYRRSFPRVSGRALCVTWSLDAKRIFSGSSDGYIRCWDAQTTYEIYRITAGLGGLGTGPEHCIWSLIFLRCGTLVSGESTGSVQFWDSHHGTLLQAHSCHKGDVNALMTVPNHHHRVYSAGSDGQIILYKLCFDTPQSGGEGSSSDMVKKWVYVGYVRAHTHDVRALTVAVPICREDGSPERKRTRPRKKKKPIDFSYHKWAHMGVPMLISGGDDTKLYAYSAKEFTKFAPHDICPAPQRLPIYLVTNTIQGGTPMILVQCPGHLDVLSVNLMSSSPSNMGIGRAARTTLVARVKSKASRKIICSAISSNQALFAYSDHFRPKLFGLECEVGKRRWKINERMLPKGLPFAHCMAFCSNSSCLLLAGPDRKIYLVDVERAQLLGTLVPLRRNEEDRTLPPSEPPITKLLTSLDGQWLAAINCFGDIYVFNLEIQRQHWFISRLHGASVTAGGFAPKNSNILFITTSSNQVYVFDVEAKQLGEWSKHNTFILPRRFQEFPGEVIGLFFPPSLSSSVIVYSSRAMCLIDFGLPVVQDDDDKILALDALSKKTVDSSMIKKIKRKREELDNNYLNLAKRNFDFTIFKVPVLFVGHVSENSLLFIEKPWLDVVQKLDAPQHRHIYGT